MDKVAVERRNESCVIMTDQRTIWKRLTRIRESECLELSDSLKLFVAKTPRSLVSSTIPTGICSSVRQIERFTRRSDMRNSTADIGVWRDDLGNSYLSKDSSMRGSTYELSMLYVKKRSMYGPSRAESTFLKCIKVIDSMIYFAIIKSPRNSRQGAGFILSKMSAANNKNNA